jgi:cytochrome c oxidase assembly protein subunit 15
MLALVTAGGLVTSNDAALSVPDWPLSWGRLVPPLEGGICYEFAHRALAAIVTVLVATLAISTQNRDPRPWMRKLAWSALAAVLAQALLGGALVKFVDPKILAISHACLAQLCFGLTVAIAAGHYPSDGAGKSLAPQLAVVALFGQTILGAAVRHNALGLASHIVGAIIASAIVMWAAMGVLIKYMEDAKRRRPAVILLGLTATQIFLGFAAYTARAAAVDDPQPMPLMVWTTVAHVAVGALAFGAAIQLAMTVRSGRPNLEESARLPVGAPN